MTEDQLVYSIREKLSQYADDSDFDNREILFEINLQRALYLRNLYNTRHRTIDPEVKQILCVPMIEASPSECGCLETDCTVLRSKEPLPSLIELHDTNGIFYTGPADVGSKPFSYVSYIQAMFSGERTYSQNTIYTFMNPNGHLFLKSKNPLNKMIDCIMVHAILEFPEEAAAYNNPNGSACYDRSITKYPVKAHALAYITELVVQRLLFKLGIPVDRVNDSSSELNSAGATAPAKKE